MWVAEVLLKCLASVLLFVVALLFAAVGICGAARGGVMFFQLTPIEILAGLALIGVSLGLAGYLAMLAGIYGLLLFTYAYDAMAQCDYFNHPESLHSRRTEVLQFVMWGIVAGAILIFSIQPDIRSKFGEWFAQLKAWRTLIGLH